MTWPEALLRDLENVKTGKQDAGEDVTRLQAVIDSINDGCDKHSVAQQLIEVGCAYFASTLIAGNYDRIAEAENGTNAQAEDPEEA